jgi:hypothetical protein
MNDHHRSTTASYVPAPFRLRKGHSNSGATNKAVSAILATAALFLLPTIVSAQRPIASGATVSENFDGLGTGTSTLPLTNIFVGSGTGANPANSTAVTVGTGSSATAGNYNFGLTGDSDRAIGSLAAGTTPRNTEARFVNLTGGDIVAIEVRYDGEQWRLGASPSTETGLTLYFSTVGGAPANFVAMGPEFNFAAPVMSGTVGALNGNLPANRTADIGGIFVPAIPIPPGQPFFLRWVDTPDPGPNSAMAIDNLRVKVTIEPHAPIRFVNQTGTCLGGTPCFSTVQAAINHATVAGDIIEVEGDFVYSEALTITARTNLTIRARAGDSPTVDSTGITANTVTIRNSPSLTLDGINLKGSFTGIVVTQTGATNFSDGLTVRNCVIQPSNGDGVSIAISMSDALFENVEFLNAGNTTGFRASSSSAKYVNLTLRNCQFTFNRRGAVLANQHNFLMENCVFYGHTDTQVDPALRPGIEISGSVFSDPVPPGITIRRNLFFAQHGAAIRVGVPSPPAQNVVIEHNTIVSNDQPDGREGIVFCGGSTGVVRNNIIVANGRWAALATDGSTPDLLQSHNLIVNSGPLTVVPGTFEITFASSPPLGPGSIVATSAGFVDELAKDFRLSCASPGIGASSTGDNLGFTNALSVTDCADCATRDSDGDGVNDCLDLCPNTPLCADVDSVGCPITTNIFSFGSVWQYDDRGLDLDDPANGNPDWRTQGLNTGTFGPGQLGVNDGDEATVIAALMPNLTRYFSRTFEIADPSRIGAAWLDVLFDDGYVIYLNGAELARSLNMPDGPVSFTTLTTFDTENHIERGIPVPPSMLVAGTNLIVVTIHQEFPTSGDVSFDARLTVVPCRENTPPVARCRDVAVPADANCLADVSVDDGSFDPDGDEITVVQLPPGPYPLGTNSVTLTVTDTHGAQSQCTATVIVRDATAPTVSGCPSNISVGCGGVDGARAFFSEPTAVDDCDPSPTVKCEPASGSLFPVGTNTVTCTITDASNNSSACSFQVVVAGPTVVFLPPIHTSAENLVRVGQTFPVKAKVDCGGANVRGLAPEIRVAQGDFLESDPAFEQEITQESTSAADTTGVMREADGFYIYNLGTRGLAKDSHYTIIVRVRNSAGAVVAQGKALIRTKSN